MSPFFETTKDNISDSKNTQRNGEERLPDDWLQLFGSSYCSAAMRLAVRCFKLAVIAHPGSSGNTPCYFPHHLLSCKD